MTPSCTIYFIMLVHRFPFKAYTGLQAFLKCARPSQINRRQTISFAMPLSSSDSVVDAEQRKQIDLETEKDVVEPEVAIAPGAPTYLPSINMIPLRHTKVLRYFVLRTPPSPPHSNLKGIFFLSQSHLSFLESLA